MSIPNICHFCYATALFGPVKSTLKSAQVRNKIANISPAWQKLRYRPLVSNISFGNETTVKKVKSQLWFGWILWTDKKTLRLMLRFLVVWAARGKWVSAVKMWSSLNVSLSWPMLLLAPMSGRGSVPDRNIRTTQNWQLLACLGQCCS